MKATITVQMDNAAFDENGINLELASILERLTDLLRQDSEFVRRSLYDSNGNKVGEFLIEE